MSNTVCLTKLQSKYYTYMKEQHDKTGYYPAVSEVARALKVRAGSVVAMYGSLFMRGAFTEGKPQTTYHVRMHERVAVKANKAPARKQTAKTVQKQQVARLLLKLLTGDMDSKEAGEIANQLGL